MPLDGFDSRRARTHSRSVPGTLVVSSGFQCVSVICPWPLKIPLSHRYLRFESLPATPVFVRVPFVVPQGIHG
jgi:hypothetical protein